MHSVSPHEEQAADSSTEPRQLAGFAVLSDDTLGGAPSADVQCFQAMELIKRFLSRAARKKNPDGVPGAAADPRRFLLDLLPRRSIGAEIGVHQGDFSFSILCVVEPRILHLIDPWKHESSDEYKDAWYGGQASGQAEMEARYTGVMARFKDQIRSGQVRVHRGSSEDVLSEFADEYFDWVYIDGNHRFEFAKKDLALAFDKTKPGGYITGDDYSTGGWWQGGVKIAVDEFVERYPVEIMQIHNRQFVLRKTAPAGAGR